MKFQNIYENLTLVSLKNQKSQIMKGMPTEERMNGRRNGMDNRRQETISNGIMEKMDNGRKSLQDIKRSIKSRYFGIGFNIVSLRSKKSMI